MLIQSKFEIKNNEDFYKEVKEALEESKNCEWHGEEIFNNLRKEKHKKKLMEE